MKNKLIRISAFFLALLSFAYYTALKISDPGSVIDFSLIFIFFGLVCVLFFIAGDRIIAKSGQFFRHHRVWGIGFGIFCALFCAVSAGILLYICLPIGKNGAQKCEYLIVLGGGIRKNGDSSNSLENRLETAADYMLKNPGIAVIVSGGKSPKEPWPEALTMARFLEEKTGYDEKLIIQEDKSRDTIQNFAFSRALIIQREKLLNPTRNLKVDDVRVLVLTNEFHLRRSIILAHAKGFTKCYGLSAPSPLLSIPINYLREIGSYWKLGIRTCVDFCVRTISR